METDQDTAEVVKLLSVVMSAGAAGRNAAVLLIAEKPARDGANYFALNLVDPRTKERTSAAAENILWHASGPNSRQDTDKNVGDIVSVNSVLHGMLIHARSHLESLKVPGLVIVGDLESNRCVYAIANAKTDETKNRIKHYVALILAAVASEKEVGIVT
jgi:hypothetical protein